MYMNEEDFKKEMAIKNHDVYFVSSREFHDHIALTVLENCI